MKQRKIYASRLTKEDLIKSGITLVTEDGYVFKGEDQVSPSISAGGYFVFPLYDLDEDGNKIKVPITRQFKGCKKVTDTYTYKTRTIGLHRLMWAWFKGEVPEGYVVDHINNKHETQEDYHIENLQLLTQAQNLAKERPASTKQLYCNLNKPLSFYEDKLQNYVAKYEEAKKNHQSDLCHKLRTNIANTKARIRYWKAHQEEAERIQKEALEEQVRKEAYHERAAQLRELEEIVLAKRNSYLDAKYDYGPSHFMTLCAKKEWHDAVADRNHFLGISG